MLILFPYLPRRPVYIYGKNSLVRYINSMAPEIEYLIQPIFHLDFHQVSHVKKLAHRATNCVVQSPPIDMDCTIE